MKNSKKNVRPKILMKIKNYSQENHLNDIRKGDLYFNDILYFQNFKTEGIGDVDEGVYFMENFDFSIIDNDKEYKFKTKSGSIKNNVMKDFSIFCFYTIDTDKAEKIIDDIYFYPFTSEDRKMLGSDFLNEETSSLLFLDENTLLSRIKQLNIPNVVVKEVNYLNDKDFKKMNMSYLKGDILLEKIYSKRDRFKHQKEYRILCDNKNLENEHYLRIGDMSHNTCILSNAKIEDIEGLIIIDNNATGRLEIKPMKRIYHVQNEKWSGNEIFNRKMKLHLSTPELGEFLKEMRKNKYESIKIHRIWKNGMEYEANSN